MLLSFWDDFIVTQQLNFTINILKFERIKTVTMSYRQIERDGIQKPIKLKPGRRKQSRRKIMKAM